MTHVIKQTNHKSQWLHCILKKSGRSQFASPSKHCNLDFFFKEKRWEGGKRKRDASYWLLTFAPSFFRYIGQQPAYTYIFLSLHTVISDYLFSFVKCNCMFNLAKKTIQRHTTTLTGINAHIWSRSFSSFSVLFIPLEVIRVARFIPNLKLFENTDVQASAEPSHKEKFPVAFQQTKV